ncbi:MAG: integrase core domain-containing protein, partial [Anaerolineales bacterium]|nr:integrase core domain-containing protein [Anaerolineales bacterium]
IESFNGNMGDMLLAKEIFHSLKEAQIMIETWLRDTTLSSHIMRCGITHLHPQQS